MTIPVTGYAGSTIVMYAELRAQDPDAFTADDDDILAVLDAWDGRRLTVTADNQRAIVRGLTDLSNCEDAAGGDFARHACNGLSGAAMRVSRLTL